MERMCETLLLLRTKYHFNGYIHVKTIPGASDELLAAAGYLADRISINMELPTQESLCTLAPNKTMKNILNPMGKVQSTIASHRMANRQIRIHGAKPWKPVFKSGNFLRSFSQNVQRKARKNKSGHTA